MVTLDSPRVKQFFSPCSSSCQICLPGLLCETPMLHPGGEGIRDMSADQGRIREFGGTASCTPDGRDSPLFAAQTLQVCAPGRTRSRETHTLASEVRCQLHAPSAAKDCPLCRSNRARKNRARRARTPTHFRECPGFGCPGFASSGLRFGVRFGVGGGVRMALLCDDLPDTQ